MKYKIKNIFCGKPQEIQKGKNSYQTSYKKQAISKPEFVNLLGFEADTQSETSVHGGEDKAVCVYCENSYKFFKQKHNIDLGLCGFGENITLLDCDDKDFCLGDRFSCGEVVFEVSQPRNPCWKISAVTGIKKLTALLVKEAKSGFYLRVVKEGKVGVNDEFKLLQRIYPKFTIEHINNCFYDAKNHQEDIKEILEAPKLASSYKKDLQKRYKNKDFGLESYQEDRF